MGIDYVVDIGFYALIEQLSRRLGWRSSLYIYDIYKDHLQISNTDKVSFQDVLAGD